MANRLKNIVLSAIAASSLVLTGCDPSPVNEGDGESKYYSYQSTNQISLTSTSTASPYLLSITNPTNYASILTNNLTTNVPYSDPIRQEGFNRALQHQREIQRLNEMNKRKQKTSNYHP